MNEIGRLDGDDRKELNELLDNIFAHLDKDEFEKAKKKLYKVSKTPNYFIREYLGKSLTDYSNKAKVSKLVKPMLKHKIYGVRATALFFFYELDKNDPDTLFQLLEKTFDSVPWEVESVINDMWNEFPDFMKENIVEWIKSENSQKRALSFHGMENIAKTDPGYIMEFISKAIDDDRIEVQKKITHILTQVARSNPIFVFPYIREWLSVGSEKRIKTIWVSMKKLANIVVQRSRRDKSEDFVLLTQQTIEDWVRDENENVSAMGERLTYIINR
ncbi:MAG: DNA alkylation repair protein [Candidatus Cloacimonetes bacterium]|nr:DNA alkylation repair protein [Candidatus Cloacimonadota bacterium]